jgi:gas vesicle protein
MSEEIPGRQTRVLDRQRLRTFLLGGAAGILAGILLAPRSGKELRGSVMERAGEARERSRETLFEARERMQERLSEAREGPHRGPPEPPGSRQEEDEPAGWDAERSEELRRKVRETRARLRGRPEGPREAGEDRDPELDR